MSKAKTLAGTVSTGGVLADGTVSAAEVSGLATVATTGAYADLSGKPGTNDFLPSQTGNNGKYLTTDGSSPSWATVTTGTVFIAKTTTYTAVAGDTLLVDTSGGSFTITLPASPATGNTVYFQDAKGTWFTSPLTIGRNGQTIMGAAEDFTASSNNAGFGLVYNGSDWRVY